MWCFLLIENKLIVSPRVETQFYFQNRFPFCFNLIFPIDILCYIDKKGYKSKIKRITGAIEMK